MIAKIKAGTLGGEAFTLHLANQGLKIGFSAGYELAPEARSAAEAAIAGIENGSITPLK
jgi:hypothetical protein